MRQGVYRPDKDRLSGRAGLPASRGTASVATGIKTAINAVSDTIRDSLQAEAITKEVPVSQVFDFSYLLPR